MKICSNDTQILEIFSINHSPKFWSYNFERFDANMIHYLNTMIPILRSEYLFPD